MNDKIKHFIATLLLCLLVSVFFHFAFGAGVVISLCGGCGTSLAVGVLKEIYDCRKTNPTGFSIPDLFADCAGAALGACSFLIFA
jgi:hypothetical protein